MKRKIMKALCLVTALAILLAFPVKASATAQGTNGTELNILQAQKIEIQFGPDWSGVEFELKTDAGKYPGIIQVGEDGVLRLEIGGSSRYLLVYQGPKPPTVQETEPENTAEIAGIEENAEPAGENTSTEIVLEEQNDIPVKYIVIFLTGLVIAILLLVGLAMRDRRNGQGMIDENDEF